MKRIVKKSANSDSVTLDQAYEEFILEKEMRNLSKDTIRNYNLDYKLFYQFHDFNSETTTDEITQQHIYKWVGTMKLNGVKPTSINHYLSGLRAFLYWCMDEDRRYIEPRFKIMLMEQQEETFKLFSDDDVLTLLEKPRRQDSFTTWRNWAIVNWVLGTGNRAATICDVRITDINFAKKEITLRHTKNKRAQIIPLSSSLETVIKEYIRVWRKDADVDGWLFPNVGDEQMTTNALRLSFTKYCHDRGVRQSNIHGLRHNFAKGWVQNNGNMFVLQKILGHSTLEMTRRYVRLFAEDIKEDYDKFNPLDTLKRASRRTQKIHRAD